MIEILSVEIIIVCILLLCGRMFECLEQSDSVGMILQVFTTVMDLKMSCNAVVPRLWIVLQGIACMHVLCLFCKV